MPIITIKTMSIIPSIPDVMPIPSTEVKKESIMITYPLSTLILTVTLIVILKLSGCQNTQSNIILNL